MRFQLDADQRKRTPCEARSAFCKNAQRVAGRYVFECDTWEDVSFANIVAGRLSRWTLARIVIRIFDQTNDYLIPTDPVSAVNRFGYYTVQEWVAGV